MDLTETSFLEPSNPILMIWIGPPDAKIEAFDLGNWRKWEKESNRVVEHHLISEVMASLNSDTGSGLKDLSKDFGQALNFLSRKRPWDCVWILPLGLEPGEINLSSMELLKTSELDGITFFRKGNKSPFVIWLTTTLIIRPVCFLLEISWVSQLDWLGWKNWFWEKIGSWGFGVKNRDPLFPYRVIGGKRFASLHFQSRTQWIWMEMLAKLHFMGAKLTEKETSFAKWGVDSISITSSARDLLVVLRYPEFKNQPFANPE